MSLSITPELLAARCSETITDGPLTLGPISLDEALEGLELLIAQEGDRVADDYPMDDTSHGASEARQGLRALYLAHALLSALAGR
ncbi:MAG: hypothetical protein HGA45_11520 [Chloroflexales bacterium]|nr:hypothetical protein [Chloroflexales bacterium]